MVLLIDEIDKADEEFEAFLLELLSDFQVSIPELGTIRAIQPPVVVLTSNRARELSEALKRRCLYLWLDFPGIEIERRDRRAQGRRSSTSVADPGGALRAARCASSSCDKTPSIAETLDWARALRALGIRELDGPGVRKTLAALLKSDDDRRRAESKMSGLLAAATKTP